MGNVSNEKCEKCGTRNDVETVIDPLHPWCVGEKRVWMTLCIDCEQERRDDI